MRLLTVIDEYTRECLAIRAGRSIRSSDVIETLAGLMMDKGVPDVKGGGKVDHLDGLTA